MKFVKEISAAQLRVGAPPTHMPQVLASGRFLLEIQRRVRG
jgi:hypothetical protein